MALFLFALLLPAQTINIVWTGDSITNLTAGYVSSGQMYPSLVASAIPRITNATDPAFNGAKISDMVAALGTINASYSASYTYNIAGVFIGTNDICLSGHTGAQTLADLKSYSLSLKAAGWKILMFGMLPRNNFGCTDSTMAGPRATVNAGIAADHSFWDYFVRIDQDATIGCDTCADTTAYYVDATHPNAAGYAIIAAYTKLGIYSLIRGMFPLPFGHITN